MAAATILRRAKVITPSMVRERLWESMRRGQAAGNSKSGTCSRDRAHCQQCGQPLAISAGTLLKPRAVVSARCVQARRGTRTASAGYGHTRLRGLSVVLQRSWLRGLSPPLIDASLRTVEAERQAKMFAEAMGWRSRSRESKALLRRTGLDEGDQLHGRWRAAMGAP